MQLSISEILDKASKMKTKSEKVKWLKQNEAKPLKTVLKAMYCPSLKCLLPEGAPPYTPSEAVDDHGVLYRIQSVYHISMKALAQMSSQ